MNIIPSKKIAQHEDPTILGAIIKQNLIMIKEEPITCTTKYLNALSDSAELPLIKMGIIPKKPTSIAHHSLKSPLEEITSSTLSAFTETKRNLAVDAMWSKLNTRGSEYHISFA